MYLAVILATALLASLVPRVADAASRVSGESTAAADSQEKPTTDVPATDNAKTPQSEPQEPSSDKKEEKKAEAGTEAATGNQPATGAHKRRSRAKKPPATADSEPRKTVIRHGGAAEPVVQILPGISQEEAERQRESAEQLLVASDTSLKELTTRDLNRNQRDTVVQVRQYMDAARAALQESDIQRAHTLSLKAYLLADDLVKHEK
jgi:hypothetical protein